MESETFRSVLRRRREFDLRSWRKESGEMFEPTIVDGEEKTSDVLVSSEELRIEVKVRVGSCEAGVAGRGACEGSTEGRERSERRVEELDCCRDVEDVREAARSLALW